MRGEIVMDKNELKAIRELIYEDSLQQNLSITCLILRLFQLFCEGHNQKFMHFLREQELKNKTLEINVISLVSEMLGSLVKFANVKCINVGNRIFDLLIEVIQGPCIKNQNLLQNTKVVEYCKDLIEDYHMNILFGQDSQSQSYQNKCSISPLVKKSMKFLNAILENNRELAFKKYVATIFKWKFLITFLKSEFVSYYKNQFGIKEDEIQNHSYHQLILLERKAVFD